MLFHLSSTFFICFVGWPPWVRLAISGDRLLVVRISPWDQIHTECTSVEQPEVHEPTMPYAKRKWRQPRPDSTLAFHQIVDSEREPRSVALNASSLGLLRLLYYNK